MKKHCFYFLGDSFADICNEAMFCEKHLVEGNYLDSIIRAGKASEIITVNICELEGQDGLISSGQKKRLEMLGYKGIISYDIYKRLNHIRKIRNKAVHGHLSDIEDNANILHAYLYLICAYFYKEYRDTNFSAEDYTGPIMDIASKPKETASETSEDNENIGEFISSPLDDYLFEKYDDSYLLNELSKLKDSSKEAVEDDNLSEFKEYLHIDRSIQEDFLKALNRATSFNSSHLIMLCGSVGDGKSHLIANLKKKNPELFNQFAIHYDATESFDPEKNAIDTLASVLEPFNDNNLNNSTEKLILAINLGVLNNFLESSYANEDYTKLKLIIEEANIFESNEVSDNIYGDKVSFVTFSDYNMFELNDDENSNYTSSKYISSLFNKITQKEDTNPFYVAYLKDKDSHFINPIIYNYEMLMDEEVQKTIIDYLIKIFIKYRKIISTRDLLNFIYEIIVPPEFLKSEDLDNINDFMDYSLPNLLFGYPERSDLLKLCNELDPTLHRNESLDKFIIDLNINDDTEKILNRYFDFTRFNFLEEYGEYLVDFREFNNSEKEKVTNILIRFAVFYGKSIIKNNFKDKVYLNYLKYLYAYNTQSHKDYKYLFTEVKDAIFNWKGSYKKNTICIDTLDSFKVYKNLKLKPSVDKFEKSLLDGLFLGNRFKTDIKIYFSVESNKKKIPLNVDFSLYQYIMKLYNGFKPNQSDKDDLIILDEFINNLLDEDTDDDLYVISLETYEEFLFESNDFGTFEFKRG
ncbi:dnd system-associated protein 3 [Methanobrevibacter ruminantium M1]|uniref:Dnd system-associated protein 3 n=1 Tax=Methanobrevibacter ruminantium (strain ATCC 35063 / DSM 1093 / JCM 13430 / OCM 146 / M1) TaxID=634498 RepID=D3DZZ7_METRM|nr:DNA phosphorothioation-dependent restriction protein DptF [Methanobrevibacter ruminantium]ADC46173.1 dnd system-associated protein 3 [Methanobrevibacter ruminantium M1]